MKSETLSVKDGTAAAIRHFTLDEWLARQERLHFSAIDLGLDRCREVARRMGLLSPEFKVISISGTNGKGTSATLLERIYTETGIRTGCYTSPHLIRYNERIRINGEEVDDVMLCESFSRIDRCRGDISLTYFEFGTLAALDIFHRQGVELAILEVGLGGRLDAVNIIDADTALICTIDLDHENWLGEDRDSIGYEKAGIFRRGQPAICADPAPPQSVIEAANRTGARLFLVGRDFSYSRSTDQWHWRSAGSSVSGLAESEAGIDWLPANAAGVLMVIEVMSEHFPVDHEVIRRVIRDFRMPGRFQRLPGRIEYLLDVAHNRQATGQLVASLSRLPPAENTRIVIGMLSDKAHEPILDVLSAAGNFWYVINPGGERGLAAKQLAEKLLKYVDTARMKVFEQPQQAFATVEQESVAGDRIIVTGSFLTVAAAVEYLDL